ncbi:MAG: protein translocase subunit SecF [Alphaproteobacteria bacterium]|nr:protein translocase subunit SecF [Alphaproteobacteria bacterium]MBU2083405.1 protein translocase subunit SecF [Alphaproteobacteria bacterium]MBU2143630.1 protein translocase subunit SecF [Alphaproteobacteria bacterium]MBU2195969.1 protein translocase subunit SecF [Alphaproteobacteria bacterium]
MLLRYWPESTNLKFMNLRMGGALLSVIMITASIFFLGTRGLNLGVDFAGGTVMELQQTETVTVETVRAALPFNAEVNTAVGTDARPIVVAKFGAADPAELGEEFAHLAPAAQAERAQQMTNDIVARTLKEKLGLTDEDFLRDDSVGPKVSGELFRSGILALVVALALMLAYIWFRFEWQFSVGAVAALAHDVIITLGVFSLLQLEFNLTTIAALLTIIGYSMNDTVVVFDRVREERRKYKKMPDRQVIDQSLNSTLSRTLLTSGTTLLALFAIFFLGGPVLRGMSFALIWGIFIGTYSSIFIASAIVLSLGMDLNKKPAEEVTGFQGIR